MELVPVAGVVGWREQRSRMLVQRVDQLDGYTWGHSQRVAEWSLRIGRAAGLAGDELQDLQTAALLHDAGKVVVPADVLIKPGALTSLERQQIERHPVASERLAAWLGYPPRILRAVRHHHEHWDGSGYPDRLAGTSVPLAAQVMAIADVFDALTTQRCYRCAMTTREAIAVMEADAGRAFNPDLLACAVPRLEGRGARS